MAGVVHCKAITRQAVTGMHAIKQRTRTMRAMLLDQLIVRRCSDHVGFAVVVKHGRRCSVHSLR